MAERPAYRWSPDEDRWQAEVTRAAALAIGTWLESRGRLEQPIRCLTMPELEAMAFAAISRFIVMGSERIRTLPADDALTRFMLG